MLTGKVAVILVVIGYQCMTGCAVSVCIKSTCLPGERFLSAVAVHIGAFLVCGIVRCATGFGIVDCQKLDVYCLVGMVYGAASGSVVAGVADAFDLREIAVLIMGAGDVGGNRAQGSIAGRRIAVAGAASAGNRESPCRKPSMTFGLGTLRTYVAAKV